MLREVTLEYSEQSPTSGMLSTYSFVLDVRKEFSRYEDLLRSKSAVKALKEDYFRIKRFLAHKPVTRYSKTENLGKVVVRSKDKLGSSYTLSIGVLPFEVERLE